MIRLILLTLILSFSRSLSQDTIVLKQNMKSAARAQFIFKWGDPEYMESHLHEKNYRLKYGLEEGMYLAFFDKRLSWGKSLKDTAMVAVVKNGKLNGVVKRWDNSSNRLVEECEYKNGLIHGYRKLYHYDKHNNRFTNVELYEEGLPIKVIKMEW